MTDYDWVSDDNGKATVKALKDLAYRRIKPKLRKGRISFSRKASFVIGRKSEKDLPSSKCVMLTLSIQVHTVYCEVKR